jgi:hypothetical protein
VLLSKSYYDIFYQFSLNSDSISIPLDHATLDIHDPVSVRSSTRVKCKPGYLQQYHYKLATHSSSSSFTDEQGIPYFLSSCIAYDKLSSAHKHFCFSLLPMLNPNIFTKLLNHSHG